MPPPPLQNTNAAWNYLHEFYARNRESRIVGHDCRTLLLNQIEAVGLPLMSGMKSALIRSTDQYVKTSESFQRSQAARCVNALLIRRRSTNRYPGIPRVWAL